MSNTTTAAEHGPKVQPETHKFTLPELRQTGRQTLHRSSSFTAVFSIPVNAATRCQNHNFLQKYLKISSVHRWVLVLLIFLTVLHTLANFFKALVTILFTNFLPWIIQSCRKIPVVTKMEVKWTFTSYSSFPPIFCTLIVPLALLVVFITKLQYETINLPLLAWETWMSVVTGGLFIMTACTLFIWIYIYDRVKLNVKNLFTWNPSVAVLYTILCSL